MSDARTVRQAIASLASAMLVGRLGLLEGCREIVALRPKLSHPDLSDADLLVFVGVESELEDYPTGLARQRWAWQALAEKDKQVDAYLEAAKDEILRACRSLHARWHAGG